MGKILVEVCLISARGLRRSSTSLLKHQWYAVSWLDPNNKYCTSIDVSRNDNPVWRTKFAALLDDSGLKDSTAALHVEVYSREPIFLREKLHGSANVVLKEFLAKYKQSSARSGAEEVGSYQLRKKNSNKPQGFVDVSIRISAEREDFSPFAGDVEGIELMNNPPEIKLSADGGDASGQIYLGGPSQQQLAPPMNQPKHHQSNAFPHRPCGHHPPMPYPPNYTNPPMPGHGHCPPPPPPPPSNAGYVPTFLPRSENFMNMPSSSSGGPPAGFGRAGQGVVAGVGAGALAAGAVIFGDDFMSGFDFPSRLPHASLSISTDPPF